MHLASLRPTSTFLAAAFVGCASLLACAPASAGDYQAKRVAADARWLVFIDVEGILKSNLGKFITEHGGDLGIEFGEGDMEELQAFGIDPLKDLYSITVYGQGNPDEEPARGDQRVGHVPGSTPASIVNSGASPNVVNIDDLLAVISAWAKRCRYHWSPSWLQR